MKRLLGCLLNCKSEKLCLYFVKFIASIIMVLSWNPLSSETSKYQNNYLLTFTQWQAGCFKNYIVLKISQSLSLEDDKLNDA